MKGNLAPLLEPVPTEADQEVMVLIPSHPKEQGLPPCFLQGFGVISRREGLEMADWLAVEGLQR